MNSATDHQGNHLGSYHPQMQMNQLQGPVMNGGMHPVQQNQMVNQGQGMNQVDSPASLLQQQHNFEVSARFFLFIFYYFFYLGYEWKKKNIDFFFFVITLAANDICLG